MDKCGVYQIRNIINNQIYIGSSKNIQKRWKQHIKALCENKHDNIFCKMIGIIMEKIVLNLLS